MNADFWETLLILPRIAAVIGAIFAAALLSYSLQHYSRTGPQVREEVQNHYKGYLAYTLLRLTFWVVFIAAWLALWGQVVYWCVAIVFDLPASAWALAAAGVIGIGCGAAARFLHLLFYSPAILVASFNYRFSHLYRFWRLLTAVRLRLFTRAALAAGGLLLLAAGVRLLSAYAFAEASMLLILALMLAAPVLWVRADTPPKAARKAHRNERPNILMIGADTWRADRLGVAGHPRDLTPFLDSIAQKGVSFSSCYVPCARTAPSLVSLLTGTWPHHHGVRDNFISDEETQLTVPALPALLREQGYRTAAVSDWCGADMGKFPFGFELCDLPSDQWNMKFFLRQGPKDMRLFLSLFCHNRFGKKFIPEVHFLAGVPLNQQVSNDAQRALHQLAQGEEPFLLNVFMATTHPPFGVEHPYYTLYGDPKYEGESKFVMARLTDPWEVLRRQADPKEAFDLDQIIDLYEGCVRAFDDRVREIIEYADRCGVLENTVVVIYSDHGFEFFEHDTWGQGNSAISDVSARVPLIMSGPGIARNRQVGQIVRSVDVAPTLLELAGIAPPQAMDGVSLRACLEPANSPAAMNLAAYNETGMWLARLPGISEKHLFYPNLMELLEVADKQTGTLGIRPEYRGIIVRAKDRMVREGRWKLTCQPMEDGPLYRLFDMETDVECRHDVIAEQPEIAHALKEKLHSFMLDDLAVQSVQKRQ